MGGECASLRPPGKGEEERRQQAPGYGKAYGAAADGGRANLPNSGALMRHFTYLHAGLR